MDEKIYNILASLIEKAATNPGKFEADLKGEPGKDGRGIKSIRINSDNELVIRFDDGTLVTAGKLPQGEPGKSIKGDPGEPGVGIKGDPGLDGKNGQDGVGVREINVSADGDLIFTLTNGTRINSGRLPKSGEGAKRWGGGGTTKIYVDAAIAAAIADSDVTLLGENYLSISGQAITANSINLSNTNVTGTLSIANGGTGQITANAAFNALAPSQTGNSGKVLSTDGSNTQWVSNSLSGYVPYTGATSNLDLGTFSLKTHSVIADATDGLKIYASNGTTLTGTIGVANTANVTWDGAHNFSVATQDTIAAFVGSGKTLSSLATATYPSLTELSYSKGVTSSIQTQINNKQTTDATLTALAAYNTNGLLTQTAADTFTGRTITGTSNQITVSNGKGVSGNPTLSLPQDIATTSTPTFAEVIIRADTTDTLLDIRHESGSTVKAINYSGAVNDGSFFNTGVFGFEFTVGTTPAVVTQIGYESAKSGFSGSRDVYIYKVSDQSLVGHATVSNTDIVDGNYKYRILSVSEKILLAASTTYRVCAVVPANETTVTTAGGGSITIGSGLTYTQGVYVSNQATITYPTSTISSNYYSGVAFKFELFTSDILVANGLTTILALTVTNALAAASAAITGAVTAASATLTGALSAASAAITGALTAGSVTANNGNISVTNSSNPRLLCVPSDADTSSFNFDVSGTGSSATYRIYKEGRGTGTTNNFIFGDASGNLTFPNLVSIAPSYSYTPTISAALGDSDTGLSYVGDGNFKLVSNTVGALELSAGKVKKGAPGTLVVSTQEGKYDIGGGSAGVNVYTITFPNTFANVPKVIAQIITEPGQTYNDVFAWTIKEISTTGFKVNVVRVDALAGGWGQALDLHWHASDLG